MSEPSVEHIPVLARALAEQIDLPQDAAMVDATIGQGGHSLLFGQSFNADGIIIGLDVDQKSLEQAGERLKSLKCRVVLSLSNFSEIESQIHRAGLEKVDFILADLGVCSAQLSDVDRGLSFLEDMPLDMRLDKRLKITAADIVNEADEAMLADLIFRYGEDRGSRRIARFIVSHREKQRITTTGQLASIVCRALSRPGKKGWSRIHPATRTFQALRIAVNDELDNLAKLLESAPDLLKENGKIAIISFHSLEDRLVKNNFKMNKTKMIYDILTKKPIVASREEILVNRRSRSAKLRIAQRICA